MIEIGYKEWGSPYLLWAVPCWPFGHPFKFFYGPTGRITDRTHPFIYCLN